MICYFFLTAVYGLIPPYLMKDLKYDKFSGTNVVAASLYARIVKLASGKNMSKKDLEEE